MLAEDQLQWGKDPDTMEATARALASRQPTSIVAESLVERAAYLRTMRGRMSSHSRSSTAAPLHLF